MTATRASSASWASGPVTSTVSSSPVGASMLAIIASGLLPSAVRSPRITLTALWNWPATWANLTAGRMWKPCGFVMTTVFVSDSPFMTVDFAGTRTQTIFRTRASLSAAFAESGAAPIVGRVEQSQDALARSGVAQLVDEVVVAQAARHVLQGAEVVAGPVLRRDEQDEHEHRLAVEAVEGDAGGRDGDGADELLDAGVLGVRDGDAAADAGRAEQFALEDGADDVFDLGPLELAGGAQALDHLADDALLGGGLERDDDGIAHHKIRHAHARPPSSLQ